MVEGIYVASRKNSYDRGEFPLMKPIVFGHSLGDDGRPLFDAYSSRKRDEKRSSMCVYNVNTNI